MVSINSKRAFTGKSEEILQKALRASPDSITISRLEDGRLVEVNEQFERFAGYSRAEAVGKTALELGLWKNPDDRLRLERLLKHDGVARNFHTEFVSQTGDTRAGMLSAELLEIDGETYMLATVRDITDARRLQAALRSMNQLLESERQSRTEKEAALKQVLSHIEEDKSAFRSEVTARVSELLAPIIAKLRAHDGRVDRRDVDRFEKALGQIVAAEVDQFRDCFSRLTGRELDICEAIKSGMSSKEIAEKFGLSVNTVNKHRQMIRRKLQLNNRDVNLAAYLRRN